MGLMQWLKDVFVPESGTTVPELGMAGQPVEINMERHSRTWIARHAGRLATLYGVERPAESIKQEIARRKMELRAVLNYAPENADEAKALLEKARS